MLSRARAREILDAIAGRRILVVGDLMLDRYVQGSVTRISPEAPVPVVRVAREWGLPGGAANVARNISALGGHAIVAGVVGRDAAGGELLALLSGQGVGTEGVVADERLRTTVKQRIIAERQQVTRVDWEGPPHLPGDVVEIVSAHVRDLVEAVDGVIIEDYGKGVVSQEVVDMVLQAARPAGIPVGLDPKDNHVLRYRGITLATPNYKEALTLAGLPLPGVHRKPEADDSLQEAGRRLGAEWDTDLLMITLGPDGMFLRSRDGRTTLIPTRAREVFDVTGAGDTVIATALLGLSARIPDIDAASLANYAAGMVVGKLGAATCSPAELLAFLDADPAAGA